MSCNKPLITIEDCKVENSGDVLIPCISWKMHSGEVWLVTGNSACKKNAFIEALAGNFRFLPNNENSQCNFASETVNSLKEDSYFLKNYVELVSLERAARIIQEERENDQSDYTEGGVDIGRDVFTFISEVFDVSKNLPKDKTDCKDVIKNLYEVNLCGISSLLDRGLKYLSTGEMRKVLLARALISKKRFLILSEIFAGLDVESKEKLKSFFFSMTQAINLSSKNENSVLIFCSERYAEFVPFVSHVLEFERNMISFSGTIQEYEKIQKRKVCKNPKDEKANANAHLSNVFNQQSEDCQKEDFGKVQENKKNHSIKKENVPLVEMHDVSVAWGNHTVLKNLTWTLNEKEHWLIRGPNGSGKTTFLELITGDNMQVYSNDVRLFGKRRGTGETIWDIKARLGIVSYRLHVEYRMLSGTTLRNVLLSGFKDSIGLYENPTDSELRATDEWLSFGGFSERANMPFSSLNYGEQRALLILRALVKCPKILVLDEPCHALDDEYRKKILSLVEAIAERSSTTILHVTHDASEVLPCEKHILELCPNQNPMYKIFTL